ncbi:hypothetical protein BT96DRAFT_1009346 [Gymnopus androsaceus JB14]|uniref:RRM domain-containing protein n=1 Tax=Gymnopus androsaceus JB14 TaxID=1447944 RepID=A0A6A4GD02_9AGAR|nr:hypothetical protein BT96DRAFT_1009346 [Gymnopus androsaceus JB14]
MSLLTKRSHILSNLNLSFPAILLLRFTNRSTERGCPSSLSQLSFAHAVTCPNLHALDISLYGCVSPGNDIVGSPDMLFWAEDFYVAIQQLVRELSENCQSITQLLSVWTTLTTLVIGGTAPELPSPVSEPFPCALEELGINFQTCPLVDFFRWLLHNSMDTLCTLKVEREPSSPDVLLYLIDTHCATLQSLSLPTCTREVSAALSASTNTTGRTVYVGNLPSTASVDELLNLVHFGPLESIRVLPEKS